MKGKKGKLIRVDKETWRIIKERSVAQEKSMGLIVKELTETL